MNASALNKRAATESHVDNAKNVDSDNMFRISKKPPKYRGVFPVGKRFRVVMQLDGVRHNLGMHATELEAARAYDKFAREHNKKTNFPYPLKQGPLKQAPTSTTGQPNNLTGAGGPSNGKEEHLATLAQFNDSRVDPMCGNSWPGGANTTIGDSSHSQGFQQAPPPLVGSTSYGNDYSDTSNLSEHYLSQPYAEFGESLTAQPPHVYNWQQSHLQQQQLRQQLHDPYLMQVQMAQDAQLVVYVPVPLSIAEVVTKYVNDFIRFDQQQRLHQQQLSQPQPLHPHSHHIPVSAAHLAPIFTEQSTPVSHFPTPLPATEREAPVTVTEIRVPSFQHPEVTASVSISKPSTQES